MCLILFAHRVNHDYPLVVAANRDEFHNRPTQACHYWPEYPDILAGRDSQAGGSWMGVSRSGRFAAVTNFRDPKRTEPAPRSRGELIINYLRGNLPAEQYLNAIASGPAIYAGFNLLLGDGEDLWYFSNSGHPDTHEVRRLAPGIYGLSNASLNTPWPKVQQGKQVLAEVLKGPISHSALAAATANRQLATADQLNLQGLNGEMDQLLSAQFIVNNSYGTRATTTCWQSADGCYHYAERSFDLNGELTGEVREVLRVPER